MSKLLANQIANYGDDAPIEIKEGLNIPAGKPIQAAGSAGSSGQVLSTTGATIQWITPFDGDYNSLSNKPTIPAAQINSDWNATSGVGVILNKPVVPQQPSVTTAAAGTAALSYNSTNGEFTFTPPDLSGYLTSYTETDPVFAASDAAAVTAAKISNWDTAFGWGNHASAGYLTSYTETQTLDNVLSLGATTTRDITTTGKVYFSNNFATTGDLPNATTYHGMFAHVHAEGHGYFAHAGAWTQLLDTGSSISDLADVNLAVAPQSGQVLAYDGANWVATAAGGGGGGIALTDLSVTTASAGTAALTYNNVSGVFTYTPPDVSGFLTTETDPVFTASAAAGITSTNITNWNLAYGWGNHAGAGYLTSETSHADVVVDGDFTSTGLMKRGASAGTYETITDNSNNWNTAYSWGDHGSQGYLTTVALNDVSDVTLTSPSNGQVLTYNGSVWVNSAPTGGSGGANVTISDTIPAGTPTAGDLWWESDTGRLKIYYQDTDSSQWVDTNPPLADATSIGGSGTVAMRASIIPDTNAAYDIGSAEYKIRDLYLDSGSIHTPSGNNLSFYDGNLTWGGDDVIMLQDLKDMMATATSFEDFKNAIMGL